MTNEQNSKTKLIADTLREEAVSGCFPSGRFPSEAQVIRRFGVARQTAVKAKYKDYAGGHLYVYNPKTGDVDDTLETIEVGDGRPVGYRSWADLAAHMRKVARRVWREWAEEEDNND